MTDSPNPTDSESLKDILGDDDWMYTDKPYRIERLIEAEITKRETALLDELENKVIGIGGIHAPALTVDRLQSFIASKRRPTNNKGQE